MAFGKEIQGQQFHLNEWLELIVFIIGLCLDKLLLVIIPNPACTVGANFFLIN